MAHHTGPLARGRRTTLPAAALAAALTAGATGCGAVGQALGTSVDRYSAACALLVDGSGSGVPAPEGFDAEAKLHSTLPDFLQDLDCRTLAFAPITGASQFSSCQAEGVDLDPDADSTLDRDDVRAAQRAVAEGVATELLDCARTTESGSDVLGALSRVADSAPEDGEAFHILVVSDFIQSNLEPGLTEQDLTTPESRAALIDLLAEQGRVPSLADAVVYPAGYGMWFSRDPEDYADFDAFWTELLEGRADADVDDAYRR
ncbi:hypothetical protein [Streptomyces hainanensis]|uniref:VWA domain-containing protein n=1 Tax=Streptomyces hainanensis TaxID=402648 RepID=A0A4R4TPT5_9ACTN|nr:hypothetical protein [Streptomyces hainanensis]TDC80101.1 hypothetical protein E1283_01130 [Streptomyces hainanensis]